MKFEIALKAAREGKIIQCIGFKTAIKLKHHFIYISDSTEAYIPIDEIINGEWEIIEENSK